MNYYMSVSKIVSYANEFCDTLVKVAVVKKLPGGKWTVMSLKGKPLGKYKTKQEAVKRLRQIEFFKNHKKKKKLASNENSYSSVMRDLRKSYDEDSIKKFQEEYKKLFDESILSNNYDENSILEQAMKHIAHKKFTMEKIASAINLGNPEFSGKYLADLLKFLLRRISPDNRQRAINNLKKKIYYLNEYDIASKKTPPSSSLGNAITLLKTILLEHNPVYIRNVLNNIVRYL